jgi:hypothetical protein
VWGVISFDLNKEYLPALGLPVQLAGKQMAGEDDIGVLRERSDSTKIRLIKIFAHDAALQMAFQCPPDVTKDHLTLHALQAPIAHSQ